MSGANRLTLGMYGGLQTSRTDQCGNASSLLWAQDDFAWSNIKCTLIRIIQRLISISRFSDVKIFRLFLGVSGVSYRSRTVVFWGDRKTASLSRQKPFNDSPMQIISFNVSPLGGGHHLLSTLSLADLLPLTICADVA